MRTSTNPWINTASAVMLALIGFACVPQFEHPLPADPELKPDPALLGTWSGLDGESQLSVFPRQDGWMDLVFITDTDGKSEHGANVNQYEGYTTTVADERFLCLRDGESEAAAGATNMYLLARYRINPPGRLSIQIFEQNAVRSLIESGKIEGRIENTDTTVTASSAHLVAAILAEGVEVFVSTNFDLRFARMGVVSEDKSARLDQQ